MVKLSCTQSKDLIVKQIEEMQKRISKHRSILFTA